MPQSGAPAAAPATACVCPCQAGDCRACAESLASVTMDVARAQLLINSLMGLLQGSCPACRTRTLDAALAAAVRARMGLGPEDFAKVRPVARLLVLGIVTTGSSMGVPAWPLTEAAVKEAGLEVPK